MAEEGATPEEEGAAEPAAAEGEADPEGSGEDAAPEGSGEDAAGEEECEMEEGSGDEDGKNKLVLTELVFFVACVLVTGRVPISFDYYY